MQARMHVGIRLLQDVNRLRIAIRVGSLDRGIKVTRNVLALEDDFSGIGAVICAHDVAERGLAGTIGADQRNELALLDGQIDIVDSVRIAEVLLEMDRLEEAHEVPLVNLAARRAAVPTMPDGSANTRTTSTTPSRSCQYSVLATA